MEELTMRFGEAAKMALSIGVYVITIVLVIVFGVVFIGMFIGLSWLRFWVVYNSRRRVWLCVVFAIVKWVVVLGWLMLGICVFNCLIDDPNISCFVLMVAMVFYVLVSVLHFRWEDRDALRWNSLHDMTKKWLYHFKCYWKRDRP